MKITDDIFKSIFNESVWISITISLKFIPKSPINYKSALIQVVALHRTACRCQAITNIDSSLLTSTQSNFTEYKQDMVAVFYAPVNGQWVN